MFNECMSGLDIKEDGIYVDCTLGGGGHTEGILKSLTAGRVFACDLDNDAINNAIVKLKKYEDKITYFHSDYKNLVYSLRNIGINSVDGILIDLGVSSYQLDCSERGFSYSIDAKLDMRMNKDSDFSAYNVVNEYSQDLLTEIFFKYGEERYARKIASAIVELRRLKPISTTLELSQLIIKTYPRNFNGGHPAKRCFQAIRIEVNGELDGLENAIFSLVGLLKSGGRMVTIAFHSLEDRIIKTAFKALESECLCDKSLPQCVCGKKREITILTKKPLTAGSMELAINNRAASAKLRIIEKL